MIPKYVFDLIVLIIILSLVLWVKIRCVRKKEHYQNQEEKNIFLSPSASPSSSSSSYRNNLRLIKDQYPNVVNELLSKYVDYYDGDGTYKRVPLKHGSINLPLQLDEGVLKYFRVNTYLNTDSMELTYPLLNQLLNKIIEKRDYPVIFESTKLIKKDNLNLDYIHEQIVNKLMLLINKIYIEDKYETIYNLDDTRKYKIFKKQIISDTEVEGLTQDNRLVILFLSFYKEDKDYYFTIQLNCNYNIIQNIISISQIDIVGINENEKLKFDKYYPLEQKYCILDNKYTKEQGDEKKKNQLVTCHQKKFNQERDLSRFEDEFNKTDLQDFFLEKENEKKRHEEQQKYKCFDNDGFSRSTCESYSFDKKTYGIWDKPCVKNEECPFYKSNKNYPNTRGGCINGYCEMPINIKSRGYKYYNKSTKPFCHGCERKGCSGEECFTCCEEQDNNKFKYPGLKSSDFMFLNDNR